MLGTLRRGKAHYEGEADGGVEIMSDLSVTQPEHVARESFEVGARLLETQLDVVLDAVTTALRPLYNETWREDEEPELDVAAFRAALSVSAMSVTELDNPAFLVVLYLDCGDLFAGHAVEVMLERDGRLFGNPGLVG